MIDVKGDFPLLQQTECEKPIAYLDNAATTQKPQSVIDAISNFYRYDCSNVHRAITELGERATEKYEQVREKVAQFIGAQQDEIIFTRGTTAGINAVATMLTQAQVKAGDRIIVTVMEHHANLIPWQQVAKAVGAELVVVPLTDEYEFDFAAYEQLLTPNTKVVAVSHVSNVLGTVNDIKKIIQRAKDFSAEVAVAIDAAQSVPYLPINVRALGCDFLTFSGHKMLGPTGIGVLYLAQCWHERLNPYQFGGGMVFAVTEQDATWANAPAKFEAGTMPIAEVIGLGAAIDYYQAKLPWHTFEQHIALLMNRLLDGLAKLPHVRVIGNKQQLREKGHLVSFVVDKVHAHDVAAYASAAGICIRAGHHCAQPLHTALGVLATVRVSFHAYNTTAEIDRLLAVLANSMPN